MTWHRMETQQLFMMQHHCSDVVSFGDSAAFDNVVFNGDTAAVGDAVALDDHW